MRKMTLEIMIMMEDEALKNAIEYVKNNDILIKFGKVTPENINKFIKTCTYYTNSRRSRQTNSFKQYCN